MLQRIFFILVCAILLTACAGASQQAVTEITVEATDFTYPLCQSLFLPANP
jgi:hypothetical protein